MKQPSLDVLMQKVDSKYTLVVAAAKRARVLMEDPNFDESSRGLKAVSVALNEMAYGKVGYERTREGIK